MKKTLTNLLRSAFAVACLAVSATAFAGDVIPEVVAAGGTTSDDFSCTIGQVAVNAYAGMWADAVEITDGINGVISDAGIVIGNAAGDRQLNISLPGELIDAGAFYNVYNIQGMLLETGKIDTDNHTLNYGHLLTSSIIITINTSNGVVATYKLSK